jgi:hypothetical protein
MAKRPRHEQEKVNTGRVLRPKAEVLSDATLLSPRNRITPPPNRFTHEVTAAQPYFFDAAGGEPAGEFAAGTKVVLLVHDGGLNCHVVDSQGLYVVTRFKSLRALNG